MLLASLLPLVCGCRKSLCLWLLHYTACAFHSLARFDSPFNLVIISPSPTPPFAPPSRLISVSRAVAFNHRHVDDTVRDSLLNHVFHSPPSSLAPHGFPTTSTTTTATTSGPPFLEIAIPVAAPCHIASSATPSYPSTSILFPVHSQAGDIAPRRPVSSSSAAI